LIGGAAVLLVANGIIRTAKQLPEVSGTAVWGRVAICLVGASCDWWGGNMPHPRSLLPGLNDQDAWPPVE